MSMQISEGVINWSGGQRITLKKGSTATCTTLNPGQLYAIFFYNSGQNDQDAPVQIVWSNGSAPQTVIVPGTTGNNGLASLAFVSGSDTQTVSVSIPTNSNLASVDTWLGSVAMPTDTSGLNNAQLPANSNPQAFDKYRRYFTVPASKWYNLTIVSTVTQFFSVQFRQSTAVVNVVSSGPRGILDFQIVKMGPTASAAGVVENNVTTQRSITTNLFGDGQQYVWMNADSQQNSDDSTIALQSLSFQADNDLEEIAEADAAYSADKKG